jgi:hypothetical protein
VSKVKRDSRGRLKPLRRRQSQAQADRRNDKWARRSGVDAELRRAFLALRRAGEN